MLGGVILFLLTGFLIFGGEEQLRKIGLSSAKIVIERGREYYHNLKGKTGYTCATCHGNNGKYLQGVYAKMPRYYTDINKVADADLRVKACLKKYVGVESTRLEGEEGRKYIVPLVGFIASLSDGEYIGVEIKYEEEQKLYNLGKRIWNRRAGAMDLSCALCHENLAGKRLYNETIPLLRRENNLAKWPVYSVSRDELLTLEDKIRECFERFWLYNPDKGKFSPSENWVRKPPYYTEELIGLQLYLMYSVKGIQLQVPGVVK